MYHEIMSVYHIPPSEIDKIPYSMVELLRHCMKAQAANMKLQGKKQEFYGAAGVQPAAGARRI